MQRRRAILAVMVAIGLAATVVATDSFAAAKSTARPATTAAAVTTTTTRLAVPQLKIMNYYPADAGWTLMWSAYSHSRTANDFTAIASLGANTVRVIVQPNTLGYPNVSAAML